MRLREASDVHNEFRPNPFQLPELEHDHETTLILAGDLDTNGRVLRKGGRWFPEGTEKFVAVKEWSRRFKYVIIVLGNHDYYGGCITDLPRKFKLDLKKLGYDNVFLLQNDVVVLDGVKFIGATLWTDYNNRNMTTMAQLEGTIPDDTGQYTFMTDFKKIKFNTSRKIRSASTFYIEHVKSRAFIKTESNKPFDGTVVVVTHHAPTMQSIDPRYRLKYHDNGGYASDMTQLIKDCPQIKLWFHGHIHHSFDYMFEQCRIICNPFGYHGIEVNHHFSPLLEIDTNEL